MASRLRVLGRLARQALAETSETSSPSMMLQQRMAHGEAARYSPKSFSKEKPIDRGSAWVGKNPYVEAWVWRRDHFEREFSWNFRNTVEIAYYVVGISVGFYALSVFCVRSSDARSGYPKRHMLFAETKDKAFVLPDEREFY